MESHASLPGMGIYGPHLRGIESIFGLSNCSLWARNSSNLYFIISTLMRNWNFWDRFMAIWGFTSYCLYYKY